MSLLERAEAQYNRHLTSSSEAERNLRQSAWAEFQRLGLPDKNNEGWKYSSLKTIENVLWTPPADTATPQQVTQMANQWSKEFDVAISINGKLVQGPTYLRQKPIETNPKLEFEDGFAPLATAANQGGYSITETPQKPLLLIHYQSGSESWLSSFNQIEVQKNAQVQIAEIFLGTDDRYMRSNITAVTLHENSNLTYVRIQEEGPKAVHFSEVQATLQKDATLHLTQMNNGATWSRTALKADINGQHAEARMHGISFGKDQQHIDQVVQVRHNQGESNSAQLFKGVLKDRARGVLNGRIKIAPNAQKVISSQLNHNLLLSPQAEADTKPELEIFADDVKANHGATVGRLDDERLFYLISRGLKRAQAEDMLAKAFVGDIIMRVPSIALKAFLTDRTGEQL